MERLRTLAIVGLATACWAFSFGVEAPVASLWLQEAGHGATVIGLNTATYFLAIAIASPVVPFLMRRWGRGCIFLGMVASGVTVAAFPWGDNLIGYFLLRALNGVASALSLIPLETWLGLQARPEQRARSFGFYVVCVGLGMACGTLVGLHLFATAPYVAFVLGGTVAALAGCIFLVWLPSAPATDEEVSTEEPLDIGSNLLGFGSAWNQGVLEAGMMALVPVYLLGIGFTEGSASWLMSGVILGLIGAQLPIAWLADRLGRTTVLLGCYGTAVVGLVCLPFCSDPMTLALWMGLVGVCAGAFYPLGLALLSENVPAGGLARANATFLAINCLGSVLGPVTAGAAMDLWGGRALFDVGLATMLLTLSIWGVGRWLSAVPALAKTPTLAHPLVRGSDARTPLVPPR